MKDETIEIQMYRRAFQMLLATGSSRVIQNDSVSHAMVLIEELILSAKREIVIYCTELNDEVWNTSGILDAMTMARNKGVVVDVLTRKDVGSANKSKEEFERLGVSIAKAKLDVVKENFIVVDRTAFRLETDPVGRKGMACAHSPLNAQALLDIFAKIKMGV